MYGELFSQINTNSPYSRFGLGDIENQALGRSIAMGGTAAGIRLPFEINIINPASYSALPLQTFLFQAGIRGERTDFTYKQNVSTAYGAGITSLSAAYCVNKYWGMSFGLTPISSVGYKINTEDSISAGEHQSKFLITYSGEGGLNQAYIGNAFSYNGISIGVNIAYVFGVISRKMASSLNDGSYSSILLDESRVNVSDFSLRYGVQYTVDSILNEFNYFTVGAFYENKTKLNTDVTRFTNNIVIMNGNQISDTLADNTTSYSSVGAPAVIGLGFSLSTKQFITAFDYIGRYKTDVELTELHVNHITNSSTYALGFEFTPDFMSKRFFKAMNYRIGGYYSNTNLELNNKQIKDIGMSFGLGIPAKKSRTKINIGFEVGTRGTDESELIKEKYYTINLNFNMADIWFVKRKFN